MDSTFYLHLYNYLDIQQYPESFNYKQKQQLRNQAKKFCLQDNLLFKTDNKNQQKLYRVIRPDELSSILYMFHNDSTSGHLATENMYNKIKE